MVRLKSCLSTLAFLSLLLFLVGTAHAKGISTTVYKATDTGNGPALGTVTITDEPDGVVIVTNLHGLPPGKHGFHIHEKPDCGPVSKDGKVTHAGAAGGHYDPDKTGKHLGPGGGGHKGDLPVLTVGADGTAKETLRVKGVKSEDFKNRAIMIHEGGDNYSDTPAPLGGGGARIGCGILQ